MIVASFLAPQQASAHMTAESQGHAVSAQTSKYSCGPGRCALGCGMLADPPAPAYVASA